jgi:hypothetical protein
MYPEKNIAKYLCTFKRPINGIKARSLGFQASVPT